VILTLDLGTSATKATLWSPEGRLAGASAALVTRHPAPGWCEQDGPAPWASVLEAVSGLAGADLGSVTALGLTGARESFVACSGGGRALGPVVLWSDQRAGTEAAELAGELGGLEQARSRTGQVMGPGSTAAKLRWLARAQPGLLASARWLLAPRDLVGLRLTGRAATDATMASRTGLYELATGRLVAEAAGPVADKLPPVLGPGEVAGELVPGAARELGLAPGLPVVLAGGDRACEVVGTGAGPSRPMVSWGTTANVSVPAPHLPPRLPRGLSASRSATGGFLYEAGLSAAGGALAWLAGLCGTSPAALEEEAEDSPVGARGVVWLPWLHGARAPWWTPHASASILGLRPSHRRSCLARALFEAVALDVARSLEAAGLDHVPEVELAAAGGGSASQLWLGCLAGATGRPVSVRACPEGASAGAALLAARACGQSWELERLNPVSGRVHPDPTEQQAWAVVRAASDQAAAQALGLRR
jgi:xylulokinase